MAQKPSIPKGMRDFSPVEVAKRTYIFETIKSVFKLYGYQPIETPTMENLSSLLGKYGDEGDKLLFKVLNSGDFTRGADLTSDNLPRLATQICEKGLRYDLTVPFARYVVQHQNEITFPFKRYQIQPVWRADRPQKGRYREFYQCDVDVVGSDSLLFEAELMSIVGDVFSRLGINVALKINNRKLLYGIAQTIGFPEKMVDITVAIDKLDKIGLDAVNAELIERGLTQEAVEALKPILQLSGDNDQKISQLREILKGSETGQKGLDEMQEIFRLYSLTQKTGLSVELDLSLARGLSYYTGAIFEVKALDHAIGSISGGGRYDELTAIFGLKGVSGVGISFGADRIYDVMEALELFPDESITTTDALFVNFGAQEQDAIIPLLTTLRAKGISVELYPKADKLKKQFDYAQKKGIRYMIFIGSQEIEDQMATVKDIIIGEQCSVAFDKLENIVK
ncbi:MAG: histidine--tRNA ligase [Rikenellaceae bacterium]